MMRAGRFATHLAIAITLCVAIPIAGCGRQGDLYLPGAARDIVTRPVQSPEPGATPEVSNSPQTVDSPETPASPAPEVTAPEATAPEATDPEATAPRTAEDDAKKNGAPPPEK